MILPEKVDIDLTELSQGDSLKPLEFITSLPRMNLLVLYRKI